MSADYPPEIQAALQRARVLEYWTIAWLVTVVPSMALVVGQSQAMKTVWIEDMMGFIPPIVFLLALRFERTKPTPAFPYGFARVNSLAFIISATALTSMGAYLLFEAVMTLIKAEHASIGTIRLFGRDIWMGWLMIAVLLWSTIPSMILGRLKLPIARETQDKVLHTDAEMQKADWMTGLAGMVGVLGIGLGYWWADAAAAGLISVSILHDGINALRSSTAELIDGAPRQLESDKVAEDAEALQRALEQRYPGAEVRLRESGRYIQAQVCGVEPEKEVDLKEIWPGEEERSWRFVQLSFVPPEKGESAAA